MDFVRIYDIVVKKGGRKMKKKLILLLALLFVVMTYPASRANAECVSTPYGGSWHKDKQGYYFSYDSGGKKREKNKWMWIDKNVYYLDSTGHRLTNQWVQGVYIGPNGTAGFLRNVIKDDACRMLERDRGGWRKNQVGVFYQYGDFKIKNRKERIDGVDYWFDKSGYVVAHSDSKGKKVYHGRNAYKVVSIIRQQTGGIIPLITYNARVKWADNTKKTRKIAYNKAVLK